MKNFFEWLSSLFDGQMNEVTNKATEPTWSDPQTDNSDFNNEKPIEVSPYPDPDEAIAEIEDDGNVQYDGSEEAELDESDLDNSLYSDDEVTELLANIGNNAGKNDIVQKIKSINWDELNSWVDPNEDLPAVDWIKAYEAEPNFSSLNNDTELNNQNIHLDDEFL